MYLLPLQLLQILQSVSWLRLAKSCSISNKKNIHQYLTKRKLSQLNSSIFSKSFKQKKHSDLPSPRQASFFQQISFLKPIIIKRDNPPSSRHLGFDKIYPQPFFLGHLDLTDIRQCQSQLSIHPQLSSPPMTPLST